MKKTVFDMGLCRDGMRQLRVGALTAAMVMLLCTLLVPIGETISSRGKGPINAGYFDIVPSTLLLYTITAPLLALFLFRFLSQRNASDYYHSIPQTRTCLYVSFTMSVLFWTLLLQLAATALGCVVHLALPQYRVNWGEIAVCSVQMFACVIFVTGAVMLAVTLTGNMLANLAVSLLIIFFPRLLMLVIKICVGDSLIIVESADNYLPFLGNSWNVVTGSVFSVFTQGEFKELFRNPAAGAYTAGIGLLYLILGGFMFNRRKSETAGQASIDPKLQLVFRLLPAAIFCLIPNAILYNLLTGGGNSDAGIFYTLFELYVVGVMIYFLYELVSTRKVKNLPGAVPGLVFLAAFNVLMVFGMLGMRRSLLSFSPAAEEIGYVRLSPEQRWVWMGDDGGLEMSDYLSARAGNVKLTDEEVRTLLSARLAETVEYADLPEEVRNADTQAYLMKKVVFENGGKERTRMIRLLQTDVEKLASAIMKNQEMRDIYMNLPPGDTPSLQLSIGEITFIQTQEGDSRTNLSKEELMPVYKALQEDAVDMGFEKWYTYCTDTREIGMVSGNLYMTTSDPELGVTGESFSIGEKTPKAWKAYEQALWNAQGNVREGLLRTMNDIFEKRGSQNNTAILSYTDVSITACTQPIDGKTETYSVDLNSEEELKAFISLLEQQKNMPVNPEKGYLDVYCYVEYYLDQDSGSAPEDQMMNYSDYRMFSGTVVLAFPEEADFSAFSKRIG